MTRFTFLGGMAMAIQCQNGLKILCDPFLNKNPLSPKIAEAFYDVDLLLVTHAAYDHYGDAAELMQHSAAKIICGREVFAKIQRECPGVADDRFIPTVYGDCRQVDGIGIRTVPVWHSSGVMLNGTRYNYLPFGFVVHCGDGTTYYHTGDTCLFSDMKLIREQYRPHVMVVGISRITPESPCEMTPREAAQAIGYVSPEVAVPCHYYPGDPALEEFEKAAPYFAPHTKIYPRIGKPFEFRPCEMVEL